MMTGGGNPARAAPLTVLLERVGLERFMNIFFGKSELCVIMLPMDAIDIGNSRTAAGAGGRAWPEACAPFGGGGWTRKRADAFLDGNSVEPAITC